MSSGIENPLALSRLADLIHSIQGKLARLGEDLRDFSPSAKALLPASATALGNAEVEEAVKWLRGLGYRPMARRLAGHWRDYVHRGTDVMLMSLAGDMDDTTLQEIFGFSPPTPGQELGPAGTVDDFRDLEDRVAIFAGVVSQFVDFMGEIVASVVEIPAGERTIPMSYRRAAKLMGKGDSKDAAEWLSSSVKDGSIPCEHVTRQTHVFSRRSFPVEIWPQILPR